jgi:hypothetical protein
MAGRAIGRSGIAPDRQNLTRFGIITVAFFADRVEVHAVKRRNDIDNTVDMACVGPGVGIGAVAC